MFKGQNRVAEEDLSENGDPGGSELKWTFVELMIMDQRSYKDSRFLRKPNNFSLEGTEKTSFLSSSCTK